MKIYTLYLLISVLVLMSCNGPRNIYSSSPFISPIPMEKKATSIGVDYFTHVRERNVRDSVPGNHDNCVGLNLSHMVGKKTLLFAQMDIKNERNQYRDSVPIGNDPSFNAYDAGFDSSIVFGKRHSVAAGIELFSGNGDRSNFALAASIGIQQLNMRESGLLHQLPYQRFYKMNQISFSLQPGISFDLSDHFRFAWIVRLTILKSFNANTDYSDVEKANAGLHDKSVNVLFGLTGFYGEYQPTQSLPLYINAQFFNDLSNWNHSSASYDPDWIYIKGTGFSIGMKFIFK